MIKQPKGSKLLSAGLIVSLVCTLLVGCSSSTTSQPAASQKPLSFDQAKTGGTITVGLSDEPDSLDIQKTGMAVADQIAGNLGGGLVSQDPQTLEFKPYLATSWDVSKDGLTWTFKIRQGVTLQDGTPLTAKVFADTYKRALDPITASKVAGADLATIDTITAPDDQTLVLKLKKPFAPLLQYLSDPGWLQPLSMQAIQKSGDQYGRNPVGVGPWQFGSWENGQSITLKRNDSFKWPEPIYQNPGAPKPDQLVFKFIKESQTKLAALDSGSIDIAANVDAKDVKKYENNPNYQVLSQLRNGLGLFVMLNTRKPEFQDIHVRKAMNEAINKDALIKAVIQGQGVPAYGPLPPNFFGYDKSVEQYGYKYNIDQAKQELQQAGYQLDSQGVMAKGGKELSLDLLTMVGPWSQAAQLIQAMLKDAGVKVNIVTLEGGALVDTATKGNFDMTLMGYTYNDPDVLYLFLHSSQTKGLNFSYIQDPKLDSLLEQGRTTVNQDDRKKVYAEIQKYVDDQAWWVPLYTEKQFFVVNKRVQGVKLHPFRGLLFGDAWVNQQ